MLIDLHAHTSGISKCCRIAAPQVLESAKEAGIDGIVLTNHYQKSYIPDGNIQDYVEKYIDEYYYAKECGEKTGIRVFWGIEVTMELYRRVHMLVYGVDTDFLRKHPAVFDYTQEELYKAVKEEGGILVQAHPFRGGTTVLDTAFLDGIEISCHPLYRKSYSQEIVDVAKKNNLAVTCGGDYHADTYRPKCGMYLPDSVSDSRTLGEYIEKAKNFSLLVHEPNAEDCVRIDYCRGD